MPRAAGADVVPSQSADVPLRAIDLALGAASSALPIVAAPLRVTLLVAGNVGANGLRFMLDPRGFQLRGGSVLLAMSAALLALPVYLALAWMTTGRTCGDRVMGPRVVTRRGHVLRPSMAGVRAPACGAFPTGLLWCAGPRSLSLQDVVLRTIVVYDWRPGRGTWTWSGVTTRA